MQWWRDFIARIPKWRDLLVKLRMRRGEVMIKDNLLIIENGGKDSLEYKDRKKLVANINRLLPRVYQERGTTTLLTTEVIRPVKSIRRPRKLPFVHQAPGLAFALRCSREVEAAVLEFRYGRDLIKCACTADGKAYRYYRLEVDDAGRKEEFWMPIYDLNKSNVPSFILREILKRLKQIVPDVP